MKIIVFGASGGIGGQLLRGALEQGHTITAFVRPASPFRAPADVRIYEGDVFDDAAVAEAIDGQRAVFSALGARTLKHGPVLARAIPNIIAGMHTHFVDRLIVVGAAGALYPAGKYQTPLANLAFWIVKRTLLRHPFADQAVQERLLASSDLDYTIVRPPRLTNGPATEDYYVVPDALPSSSHRISRANVAGFMLKQLTDPRFHRRGVYLAE